MGINAKWFLAICLITVSLSAHGDEQRVVDAAKNGDVDTVHSLIKSGADVNIPAEDGTTALAHAAYQNDLEMASLLLAAKAEVNTVNDYGVTPLYLASANADAALIETLLTAGADPNTALISGETPLMAAAERGKLDAARLLLKYDADPNAQENNAGQTALMWAVAERQGAIAELLVEYEADVRIRTNSGFSSLMFAAQQGNVDTVGALLEAGAGIDEIVPKSGLTPLMIAATGGFEDVMDLLLKKGANPKAIDSNGITPLHEAAKDKLALNIIKKLIAYGADPNARIKHPNPSGNSASDSYGRGVKAPTGVSLQGATPLFMAAGLNRLENVKALLEAGADPLIPTETNITALMMAAGAGTGVNSTTDEPPEAVKIVELLVSHGAEVNTVGQFGWTPLHLAAYHGYNNVIDYLIKNGANPNTMDGFGQTPLSISYAIVTEGIGDAYVQTPRSFRRETADLLLSLGAIPLEASGVKIVSKRAAE
jgi:ankyrin repeat protein